MEDSEEDFSCSYPQGKAAWFKDARTTWTGNLKDNANPRGRASTKTFPVRGYGVDSWSVGDKDGRKREKKGSNYSGTRALARRKDTRLLSHDVPVTKTPERRPKIMAQQMHEFTKPVVLEKGPDFAYVLFHPQDGIHTDFFIAEFRNGKVRRSEGYGSLAKAFANSKFYAGIVWGEWSPTEEAEDLKYD